MLNPRAYFAFTYHIKIMSHRSAKLNYSSWSGTVMVFLANICYGGTQLYLYLDDDGGIGFLEDSEEQLARETYKGQAIIRCMQQHPAGHRRACLVSNPVQNRPGALRFRGRRGALFCPMRLLASPHSCEDKGKVQCHNRGTGIHPTAEMENMRDDPTVHVTISARTVLR